MTRWQEPAPGEREAADRGWEVVRRAYDERLPAPRTRDWRIVVAVAVGVVVLAAAFTPPGLAVLGSIRDAVRGVENAKPALFSLPVAHSRLLVNTAEGVWVVQSDGTKRFLSGYREASWSPHGLYLAALHGQELRAIEPDGDIRWSIGRRDVGSPRWSRFGHQDERIAYFAGRSLRVIGGNGKRDRLLAPRVSLIAPAWKPGTHAVTFFDAAGELRTVDVDSGRTLWRTSLFAARPAVLAWSDDGRRLLAATVSELAVLDGNGRTVSFTATGGRPAAAAFAPGSHRYALLRWLNLQRRYGVELVDGGRRTQMFAGAGRFGGLSWSPDGRWLLLDWTSADQWLFVRWPVRKLRAVSNIRANFGEEPSLAGWCCP
jgi:hypothetical protein